jgi:aminoglycoside/choline kinase family phosphotransferase
VRKGAANAMLMDAPPPHEDPGPFLHVGKWLCAHGMRAPEIYAERPERGLVLIEDFGDDRMRDWLDIHPEREEAVYARAIDALVALHARPPGPFAAYDMAVYQREAALFVEWYCPAMKLGVDAAGWRAAWDAALAPMLPRQDPGVTVLRDYHAENIMLLGASEEGGGPQGLIDFQDALVGHPAYDLVSLLQDARRDVDPALERRMLDRYRAQVAAGPEFEADYARLGAQRNAKIVGIFARLWLRDGKPRYLGMIPRVWAAMERDLAHPALAPVAEWFAVNIPQHLRDSGGGEIR